MIETNKGGIGWELKRKILTWLLAIVLVLVVVGIALADESESVEETCKKEGGCFLITKAAYLRLWQEIYKLTQRKNNVCS